MIYFYKKTFNRSLQVTSLVAMAELFAPLIFPLCEPAWGGFLGVCTYSQN